MKQQRSIWTQLKSQDGMTLIEIMIVIALIATIASLVGGRVIDQFEKAKASTTKTQMRQLGTVLETYKLECGTYPSSEQGLDALIKKPEGAPECKNYDTKGYLKETKIPKDGWQNDFEYTSDGSDFTIRSLGSDKKEGGEGLAKDLSTKDTE